MSKIKVAGSILAALLVVTGAGYYFAVGRASTTVVNEHISVLARHSPLGQIGANVIVYSDSAETVVIDTQLSALASSTRSAVSELAQTPISKVLITHWHPDHSGGIGAFAMEAEVIAHQNVRRRLSAPQQGFGLTKPGSHHEFAARDAGELPNKTLDRRLKVQLQLTAFDVVHYPNAHTDGDLVVFFHDLKVAVVGDLIWPGSLPFVDVHNGGSAQGLEASLRALLAESATGYRFIPGHGAALTFEEAGHYLEMVAGTRQWVESQLDEGVTLQQLLSMPAPPQWQRWSSDLVPWAVWVQMVHQSRR